MINIISIIDFIKLNTGEILYIVLLGFILIWIGDIFKIWR